MKVVSTEELIDHKILPYNLYNEGGEKLFTAGEVVTPGKLLQLKDMKVLYRDDESQNLPSAEENSDVQKPAEAVKSKIIEETFDMKPSSISRNKLSVDDIDIDGYKGPINKKSKIDPQTQLKIKAFYGQIVEKIGKLCCAPASWWASVSTFTSLALGSTKAQAFSYSGAIMRQGPHHGAQKSTTTGTSLLAICAFRPAVLSAAGCWLNKAWWHLPHDSSALPSSLSLGTRLVLLQ